MLTTFPQSTNYLNVFYRLLGNTSTIQNVSNVQTVRLILVMVRTMHWSRDLNFSGKLAICSINLSQTTKFRLFQGDIFEVDEMGRKFSNRVENTTGKKKLLGRKQCGKRRNCLLRAISLFLTVFSKDLYCRAFLGEG